MGGGRRAQTPPERRGPFVLGGAIRSALGRRATFTTLAVLPALASAGPQGEQIVAGTVAVTRPDSGTTRVEQGSERALVNWRQFSVGAQELVRFVQPSTGAVALNRVVGEAPSEILGRIEANGRVFLVNPHGVTFASGSQIDVGGLAASVLDIADEDFLAGRYVFAPGKAPGELGEVVNRGAIRAADGGFVVLAG